MDGTEAFTTLHFALMGLLAALVLVAIVAGVRKQRVRAAAEREVEAHAAEAGVEISPAAPARSPEPLAPASPAADPLVPAKPTTIEDGAKALADEPIVAAIAPDGTTAADTTASDTHSPTEGPVNQIKGLGPKVAARLGELGIDRVGQLAALDDAQAAELDAAMGPFRGRLARDRWIEQARLLTTGDRAGFERVFGKL
jgi:predicted flap endonuclease-1-like 5' DNA nuclease